MIIPTTDTTNTPHSDETLDRVREIIREQLGDTPKPITSETRFDDDLRADPLDLLEIVFVCETEFGIEIPNHVADLIEEAGAVGDLVTYIDAALTLKTRRA